MSVHIRERRGKLYLDIYRYGRRHWEALGLTLTGDKSQDKEITSLAEICRSKKEAQIVCGEWDLLDPLECKKTLYAYLEEMGKDRDSQKDRIVKVLPHLARYPGGRTIQLGQITAKWFVDFQDYLLKESGLSKTSANSYAYAVRMAMRKAESANIIPKNPVKGIKGIAAPEPERDFLDSDEVQRMADTTVHGKWGSLIKRAFLFGCYTGLRISDMVSLTWGDISRNPSRITKRQVKTAKKVYIPLKGAALAIINDGKEHGEKEAVFPNLKSDGSSRRFIKQWAADARVSKNVGWHTARHTFAVLSLEAGRIFPPFQSCLVMPTLPRRRSTRRRLTG